MTDHEGIVIGGFHYLLGECSICRHERIVRYAAADGWICCECLSRLSWFARCSASYRETAHASYLQAWQTIHVEQDARALMARSFPELRQAALVAMLEVGA